MKVKIQYTVDMDDIPNEVSLLVERITNRLSPLKERLNNSDPSNIDDFLSVVSLAREEVLRVDMLLADCEAIMQGFASAKYSTHPGSESLEGE